MLTGHDLPVPSSWPRGSMVSSPPSDGAWTPVDEIEQPRHRAALDGAPAPRPGDHRAALRRLGAGVHCAIAPAVHQLCAATGARVRPGDGWPPVREVVIDDAEVWRFGEARVTSPARTIVDLARFADSFDDEVRAAILALLRHRRPHRSRTALRRWRAGATCRASGRRARPAVVAAAVALRRVDAVHVVDGVDAPDRVEQRDPGGSCPPSRTRTGSSASRSFEVETVAERMLTWCSLSTRVTSESKTGTVERLDLDLHQEDALGGGRPLDLDQALGLLLQRCHVVAVRPVHRDAGTARDEADDLVPGTGVQHFASLTRMSGAPRTRTPESLSLSGRVRPFGATKTSASSSSASVWREAIELLHHRLGRDVALADRGVERRDVVVRAWPTRPARGCPGS